jgi:hypothetical protein
LNTLKIERLCLARYLTPELPDEPYKWGKFETANCPSGDKCKDTVMICEVCIHKSEMGNIMFGAMAKLWMRGEILIIGGAVKWGGTNSVEDMAGVVGGMSFGDIVQAGDISQDKMCSVLKSNQAGYIGGIRNEFKPEGTAGTLLGQLQGNNLDDMGRSFKDCKKCPDAPPSLPNSTFGWLKTTKDMASGDWKQTYPWPIDWPNR